MGDINWLELISLHWRKILGGAIGFLIALIIVIFGFGWGLFIIFCVALGVLIGWQLESEDGIHGLFEWFRFPRR